MLLQKSVYYADLLLKKPFWLISMLKTVVLLHIFVETVFGIYWTVFIRIYLQIDHIWLI